MAGMQVGLASRSQMPHVTAKLRRRTCERSRLHRGRGSRRSRMSRKAAGANSRDLAGHCSRGAHHADCRGDCCRGRRYCGILVSASRAVTATLPLKPALCSPSLLQPIPRTQNCPLRSTPRITVVYCPFLFLFAEPHCCRVCPPSASPRHRLVPSPPPSATYPLSAAPVLSCPVLAPHKCLATPFLSASAARFFFTQT